MQDSHDAYFSIPSGTKKQPLKFWKFSETLTTFHKKILVTSFFRFTFAGKS